MAGQIPRIQGHTAATDRKESQKKGQHQKFCPTIRYQQLNTTLSKRTGCHVQGMQNKHKKANVRITMDAQRIPLCPTQRGHERGKMEE